MSFTIYEFARLALAVYDDIAAPVDDWEPFRSYGVVASGGFFARLYCQSDRKRWILSFRGTDQGPDIFDDIQVFLGFMPGQIGPAHAALRSARSYAKQHTLCLTGHSLGGGIAAMLALDSGLHAVTFDAPGTARAYAGGLEYLPFVGPVVELATAVAGTTDRIINIRASFDIVSVGTGAGFGRVESTDVAGCAPFFSGPFGSSRPPRWRTAHDYGRPSLESQSWNAFTTTAGYPFCQHKMALMERELKNHPEFNRELDW